MTSLAIVASLVWLAFETLPIWVAILFVWWILDN